MRKLTGTVVSDKMQKTAVVEVRREERHKMYGRSFWTTRRFKAENPENMYRTGDEVVIAETRPLSRGKRWRIIEKLTTNNRQPTRLAGDGESKRATGGVGN